MYWQATEPAIGASAQVKSKTLATRPCMNTRLEKPATRCHLVCERAAQTNDSSLLGPAPSVLLGPEPSVLLYAFRVSCAPSTKSEMDSETQRTQPRNRGQQRSGSHATAAVGDPATIPRPYQLPTRMRHSHNCVAPSWAHGRSLKRVAPRIERSGPDPPAIPLCTLCR